MPGATPKLTATVFVLPAPADNPWDLVPDASGNLWVSDSVLKYVTKVRVSDGKVLGVFALSTSSLPLFESFDGANIWVMMAGATNNDGVQVVNSAGTVTHTYETAADTISSPEQVVFDGTNMWINSSGIAAAFGLVYKMSLTGVVAGHFTCLSQQGYSDARNIAFDGTNIWLTDGGANLYQAAISGTTITNTFPYGTYPDPNATGVLLGPIFAGGLLWLNDGQQYVYSINPSTGALAQFIDIGNLDPAPMASDGTNLWVANQHDGSVTIINLATGAIVGNFLTPVAANNWNQLSYDNVGSIWASTTVGTLIQMSLSGPANLNINQNSLRFIILPFCIQECSS